MAGVRVGDKAPDFALPGVDGKTHALSALADKAAVVVIFSCNHCPYVRAWEDRMIAIQKDYVAQGVQFLAINANDPVQYPDDSFAKMQQRAKEKRFNFPYLQDEPQTTARAFGAQYTPDVYVLDRHRVVRYHGRIDDNHAEPQAVQSHDLRNALDDLLAGKPVRVAETRPVGCTIKWK